MSAWLQACLYAVVLGFGYFLGQVLHGDTPVAEIVTPAPAVKQSDGSVIAERAPDPAPPAAPHVIPPKAKEVRRMGVTVQPAREDCPQVHVDMSLVDVDGGRRVIASSPDGVVTSAIDIPIVPDQVAAAPRRWAAGPSVDPFGRNFGAWVERDLGRIRLGAELRQSDSQAPEAWLRVGITF
ncbi:hypothetical protein [Hydrocarboniphaga sp.]|uniref:hypothetical protein n=1 Tax=Hydrocarboniphaga sp. TaxID=2033016 RepID=UPI003D1096CF